MVSSAIERRGWWCSNAEVDSEGGEVLGTGAGEEMRGSLGCHLARSVTMSCHPMMHLLTCTLPNPALLQFTLELQPMHHSVTRFHKYLHGGRFPDIRIPATRGGGSERRSEMHGDKSDDPWPVVISDPTQPPKKRKQPYHVFLIPVKQLLKRVTSYIQYLPNMGFVWALFECKVCVGRS